MAKQSDIDAESRGFYFASSGSDISDGATLERPKQFPQSAIDAASLLVPPPSGLVTAQVSAAQGGAFNTPIVLSEGIQFEAGNANFTIDAPVAAEMASFLLCRTSGMTNTQNGSVVWKIDGKEQMGINVLSTVVIGDDSIGVEIKGVCNGIFVKSDQLSVIGDRSIGFKITSTSATPIDIDVDSILLGGADNIFVHYEPLNTSDVCVLHASSIFSDGAGVRTKGTSTSTGYLVKSGHLSVSNPEIIADIAAHVEAGAELDLSCDTVVGDIIVDEDGILNVFILDYEDGNIINNGTINGIISGVPYGSYRQKHQEQSVLNASDFTTQDPLVTDTLLQVKFGPAQFGPTDPVELDALGNITINRSDQYNMRIMLEYGRINAGAFSLLFFRILINGVELGNSQYAQLDTSKGAFPIEFSGPLDLLAGDVVTVEIWRDSTGFNDGSLFPKTPVLVGTNPAPSAMVSIHRNRLVQPI